MDVLFSEHGFAFMGIIVNLGIAYLTIRTRAEMAELKVWMYQNFQTKQRRHAPD